MVTSRHVGSIDGDYATTERAHGDGTLRIEVHVADPASFGQAAVDALDHTLDALGQLEAVARAAFAVAMCDDTSQPAQYWQFHRDLAEADGDLGRDSFVAGLRLVRAGLYPDGAFGTASYTVLDFALRGPQTDQLLVARLGADGSLLGISWES